MFYFLLFGRMAFFFAVWAGVVFSLPVWAGACCFFCCLGRVEGGGIWGGGHVFFCCLGGGREFTHIPVCLTRL